MYMSLSAKNGELACKWLSHLFFDSAFVHHVSYMLLFIAEFLARDWGTHLSVGGLFVLFWGLNTGGGELACKWLSHLFVDSAIFHRFDDVPF